MHLFGDAQGPHMTHFHASLHGDHTELFWETRNTPPLTWRVLRSEVEFASMADALPGGRQVMVMQGTDTHLSDGDVAGSGHHYYTVFAQDEDDGWQRQAEIRIAPHDTSSGATRIRSGNMTPSATCKRGFSQASSSARSGRLACAETPEPMCG